MNVSKIKLAAAAAVAFSAVVSAPAHASAIAMSDLNISQLFLADPITGAPLAANASILILGESRTGTAGANFNGSSASGPGASSISSTTIGAPIDVLARCSGPSCGTVAGLLYGGSYENNATTHIAPNPNVNYALGDMKISGSAIGGAVVGLTRADAVAANPDNSGGGNATILNTASLKSNFTVGTTFSAAVGVTADSYMRIWVNDVVGQQNQASFGQQWIMTITCNVNCGLGWTNLTFNPSELNNAGFATSASENFTASYAGTLYSNARTFVAGTVYSLSINQATNATVSSIPEPASMALVGVALLGFGVAARRRARK